MPRLNFDTKAQNWIARLAKDAGSATSLSFWVRKTTGQQIPISTITRWMRGELVPDSKDLTALAMTARKIRGPESKRYAARTGLTAALGL